MIKNFKLGKGNGDFYTFNGTLNGDKFTGVVKDTMFGIEVTHMTLGDEEWNKYEGAEMIAEMEYVKKNVLTKVRKFGGNR